MKRLLFGLTLLANTQIAIANLWSCDFSVDLCDFTQIRDSSNPSTSLVSGGQLIMHTQNMVYPGPGNSIVNYATADKGYVHQTFSPSYNDPWHVDINGIIPAILEPNYPVGLLGIDHLRLGVLLGVGFFQNDGAYSILSKGSFFLVMTAAQEITRLKVGCMTQTASSIPLRHQVFPLWSMRVQTILLRTKPVC